MDPISTSGGELLAALEYGMTCAVAVESQRDLQQCAASYGDLFPDSPFDPALFSALALAVACGSPWLALDQLRVVNRAALWVFGVDRAIDHLASSRDEVQDVVQRCLAIADGAHPAVADGLARFLADVRDAVARAPAFPALRAIWRGELERMLDAMAREWDWKSARVTNGAGRLPTFDEYLANADNFGSSFVNVSQWIVGADGPLEHLDELLAASREVQRALRLVNDLATYQRELSWGDLNVLMLGVTRGDVAERINALVEHCHELLRPLETHHPRLVTHLERQIGFSLGFYRLTDYWGTPCAPTP